MMGKIYGVSGWDVNESNDPNEPCTNGNAQYTNRVLAVAEMQYQK
jgi:hypothetical protein